MSFFRGIILLFSLSPVLFLFQNCGSPTTFTASSTQPEDINGDFDNPGSDNPGTTPTGDGDESEGSGPDIIVFGDNGGNEDPENPGQGLKGKVYYLLNDSGSILERPDTMKDKNGNDVAFPAAITGVDFLIDNGFELPAEVLLPNLLIPTFSFTLGFAQSNGEEIKDVLGQRLVEAFAMDLRGTLKLGDDMEAGIYELALLSDDGAVLDADMDGDGVFETTIVNNDGTHATKMMCATAGIPFNENTAISVRLKYYQGPRTHVALSVLMKKINAVADAGQDARCGFEGTDPNAWFSTQGGADADLVNSIYGEIVGRGWFPATSSSFTN